MIISYWDCKYNEYEEYWDGENEDRSYGCSNENNKESWCDKGNIWCGEEAECEWAEKRINKKSI